MNCHLQMFPQYLFNFQHKFSLSLAVLSYKCLKLYCRVLGLSMLFPCKNVINYISLKKHKFPVIIRIVDHKFLVISTVVITNKHKLTVSILHTGP